MATRWALTTEMAPERRLFCWRSELCRTVTGCYRAHVKVSDALAERVVSLGHAMLFSNVSPGAAYFHDPDGFGYVYHRAGSFGPGEAPAASI